MNRILGPQVAATLPMTSLLMLMLLLLCKRAESILASFAHGNLFQLPSFNNYEHQPINVLFYTTKTFWTEFMDRYMAGQYLAAQSHPGIKKAVLWAHNSNLYGYNSTLSLRQNIMASFNGKADFFQLAVIECLDREATREVLELQANHEITISVRFHESHDFALRMSEITKFHADIVLFTYPKEILPYARQPIARQKVLSVSPHCANPKMFFQAIDNLERDDESIRTIDVLLAGSLDPTIYPLRGRFKKLVNSGAIAKFAKVVINGHPGYNLKIDDASLDEKVSLLDQQVANYASYFRKSKIFLLDASVFDYSLMKYTEAAMAGCLLLGTIPHDRAEMWRSFVVEIPEDATDQELLDTLQYWLQNPAKRLRRAQLGQQWMMKHFTWSHNMDYLLFAYRKYAAAQYGGYFPYAFQVTCSGADLVNGQIIKNAYCKQ